MPFIGRMLFVEKMCSIKKSLSRYCPYGTLRRKRRVYLAEHFVYKAMSSTYMPPIIVYSAVAVLMGSARGFHVLTIIDVASFVRPRRHNNCKSLEK